MTSNEQQLKKAEEALARKLGFPLNEAQHNLLVELLKGQSVRATGRPLTGKKSVFVGLQGTTILGGRKFYLYNLREASTKLLDEVKADIRDRADGELVIVGVGSEEKTKIEFGNQYKLLAIILDVREESSKLCTHYVTCKTGSQLKAHYDEETIARLSRSVRITFMNEPYTQPIANQAAVATPAPLKDDAEPMEKWSDEDLQFEIENLEKKIAHQRASTFGFLPETIKRNEEMLARYKAELSQRMESTARCAVENARVKL